MKLNRTVLLPIRWPSRQEAGGERPRTHTKGTEATDDLGPSLIDQLEDHTPAADEQLEGGEEG